VRSPAASGSFIRGMKFRNKLVFFVCPITVKMRIADPAIAIVLIETQDFG
jgi:hypothetical protein